MAGGAADRHKARSLPLPFFEDGDHRRPLAKDDSSRKTPQVGTGLYAGPRPPPAILSAMGTGYRLIYVT
ncbi:MAG TPA: hypothetical protein VL485_13405, partial [Ktedonobacteraceae bacterium]|nr:hypothetical protein [Ktedonobacteraceae bacterium]